MSRFHIFQLPSLSKYYSVAGSGTSALIMRKVASRGSARCRRRQVSDGEECIRKKEGERRVCRRYELPCSLLCDGVRRGRRGRSRGAARSEKNKVSFADSTSVGLTSHAAFSPHLLKRKFFIFYYESRLKYTLEVYHFVRRSTAQPTSVGEASLRALTLSLDGSDIFP